MHHLYGKGIKVLVVGILILPSAATLGSGHCGPFRVETAEEESRGLKQVQRAASLVEERGLGRLAPQPGDDPSIFSRETVLS